MADSITPITSFATANMKPAAAGGENIDAVWGRNVGDNLAFCRAQPQFFCHMPEHGTFADDFGGTSSSSDRVGSMATFFSQQIPRPRGHNYLVATLSANITHGFTQTPDNYGTITWGLYGDLGTYLNTSSYSQLNTDSYSYATTYRVNVDLSSYMSENSFGLMKCTSIGSSRDFGGVSTGTLTYAFGTTRLYTTWI